MKSYIIDSLMGVFAIDESGNIIGFRDFNDNNEKIIDFYETLEEDIINNDYKELLDELKSSGFTEFVFDNKTLEINTSKKLGLTTSLDQFSLEFKNFRQNMQTKLEQIGISKNKEFIAEKYKNISEAIVKKRVSQAGGQEDNVIIQIIETLDIVKKSISLFSSRLKEWYGLHFPELTDKVVDDNIMLAKMVSILGERDNFSIDKIKENFDFNENQIEALVKSAKESMGADINLEIIKDYANQILSFDGYRDRLESHLDELMDSAAPNLNAIVGSLVGAKLIAKAGGLRKLAFMPASRVQLLGAEKALYRFLKTGEKRPKHGLIFQWNQIRGSKPHHRGKISRVVSGKIGLASKVDYFSGEFMGDRLAKEIEVKIKEILQKYPNPPKQPEIQKGQQRKKQNQYKGKKGRRY